MKGRWFSSCAIGALTLFHLSGGLHAQCTSDNTQAITSLDIQAGDAFGASVAALPNQRLSGAPGADSAVNDTGAVYIHAWITDAWVQQQKLVPQSSADAGEGFGQAIATDGQWLIVGSPFWDFGANPNNTGRVHSFEWNGSDWIFQQVIEGPNPGSTRFGDAVALSGDVAVVGAPREDAAGIRDSGAVYVYEYILGSWQLATRLTAPPTESAVSRDQALYGNSVEINNNTIVVGAPDYIVDTPFVPETGKVYIYREVSQTWTLIDSFVSEDALSGGRFGSDIAYDGQTLLIGAEGEQTVNLYEENAGAWLRAQVLTNFDGVTNGRFGKSVDVDGDWLVVGDDLRDHAASNAGSVFTYRYNTTLSTWEELVEYRTPNPNYQDQFGTDVAVVDGEFMAGALAYQTGSFDSTGAVFTDSIFGEDCNANDIPDACEEDCDDNDIPDECEIAADPSADCNLNGILDACEEDCDDNGIADVIEICQDPGADIDQNGVLDLCDPDCDQNSIPDVIEIDQNPALDCNEDWVLDACELLDRVDIIFILDMSDSTTETWELQKQAVIDVLCGMDPIVNTKGNYSIGVIKFSANAELAIPLTHLYSQDQLSMLCDEIDDLTRIAGNTDLHEALTLAKTVYEQAERQLSYRLRQTYVFCDGYVSDVSACEQAATALRQMAPGPVRICTARIPNNGAVGINDPVDLLRALANDPDGGSPIPGEPAGTYAEAFTQAEVAMLCRDCQFEVTADCNANGIADVCDIASGFSTDCNENGIPDTCDISYMISADCNGNGVPDECDICAQPCIDADNNGVIDICEGFPCPWDTSTESDYTVPDGYVGVPDFFALLQHWGPCPALPDPCPWDHSGGGLNGDEPDGAVGVADFFALLQHWGPCPSTAGRGFDMSFCDGFTGCQQQAMMGGGMMMSQSLGSESMPMVGEVPLSQLDPDDLLLIWLGAPGIEIMSQDPLLWADVLACLNMGDDQQAIDCLSTYLGSH
jgi:hypothetical protein